MIGLFILFLVHINELFTLNEYGGWAVELLGLYLLGAVALFFTGWRNLQFLLLILGIKYFF
jgi:putative oxidoreductase